MAQTFEAYRAQIEQFLVDQPESSYKDLAKYMAETHAFEKAHSSYKRCLNRWGWYRNITDSNRALAQLPASATRRLYHQRKLCKRGVLSSLQGGEQSQSELSYTRVNSTLPSKRRWMKTESKLEALPVYHDAAFEHRLEVTDSQGPDLEDFLRPSMVCNTKTLTRPHSDIINATYPSEPTILTFRTPTPIRSSLPTVIVSRSYDVQRDSTRRLDMGKYNGWSTDCLVLPSYETSNLCTPSPLENIEAPYRYDESSSKVLHPTAINSMEFLPTGHDVNFVSVADIDPSQDKSRTQQRCAISTIPTLIESYTNTLIELTAYSMVKLQEELPNLYKCSGLNILLPYFQIACNKYGIWNKKALSILGKIVLELSSLPSARSEALILACLSLSSRLNPMHPFRQLLVAKRTIYLVGRGCFLEADLQEAATIMAPYIEPIKAALSSSSASDGLLDTGFNTTLLLVIQHRTEEAFSLLHAICEVVHISSKLEKWDYIMTLLALGIMYYGHHHFPCASKLFEEAQALIQETSTMRNISQCHVIMWKFLLIVCVGNGRVEILRAGKDVHIEICLRDHFAYRSEAAIGFMLFDKDRHYLFKFMIPVVPAETYQ